MSLLALALDFGQKLGWEVGFGQDLGWEMGFMTPSPHFRTLYNGELKYIC